MTFNSIAALLGAMIVLAIIPSASVFAVIARSISSGFAHGAVMVAGIVFGDLIFVGVAIYGLSAIAENMSILLIVVKYLGGAYLIWLGIKLYQTKIRLVEIEKTTESSWLSSFFGGLLITLGDQKAIFFYMSFFPAFIDLNSISIAQTIAVMAITIVAVGGVKLGYAYMANRSKLLLTNLKFSKSINIIAGTIAIGAGIFLIAKN